MRRMRRALLALTLLLSSTPSRPAPAPPRPPKNVDYWLKQLRTGDVLQRQEAAEALGRMGARAEKAIPALVAALDGRLLRRPAAFALAGIGPKAIPALVTVLQGNHDEAATLALARIGRAAVPALVAALKKAEGFDRCKIMQALSALGPQAEEAIPLLIELLENPPLQFKLEWKDWNSGVAGVESVSLPVCKYKDDSLDTSYTQVCAADALINIGPRALPAVTAVLDRRGRTYRKRFLRLYPSVLRHALHEGFRYARKDAYLLFPLDLLVHQVPAALDDALWHWSWQARLCALVVLESRKWTDEKVVPALIRALGDPNEHVRHRAISALGRRGSAAQAAQPNLLRLMRSEHNDVILAELANTLKAIGPPSRQVLERDVIPPLIAHLKQPRKPGESLHVASSLARLAPREAVPVLWKLLLQQLDENQAHEVVKALEYAGKEAMPVLIETLARHAIASIRRQAADSLRRLRPRPRSALPALRAALADPDDLVRLASLDGVVRLETDRERRVSVLIHGLGDASGLIRTMAAGRLWHLGREAQPAMTALHKALEDADEHVACIAALALLKLEESPCKPLACLSRVTAKHPSFALDFVRELGGRARALSPVLEGLLSYEDARVRAQAACALYRVHPARAKKALPVLRKLLHQEVRSSVFDSLCEMDDLSRELLPDLIEVLTELRKKGFAFPLPYSTHPRISRTPVWEDSRFMGEQKIYLVLSKLGGDAALVVPELLEHLRSEDTALAAAYTLGCMGEDAAVAIPHLLPLLKHANSSIRGQAAFALGLLGPAARSALPRLRALVDDEDASVRVRAAAAVFQQTGDTKRDLPRLLRELRRAGHKDFCRGDFPCLKPATRRAVVRALAADLQDPDHRVRRAATRALASLGIEARALDSRQVARLRELAGSADEDIAQAARGALEAIEDDSNSGR